MILYNNNDQSITLPSVKDKDSGAEASGASVTATLYDLDGNAVLSPMAMMDQGDGSYTCDLDPFNLATGEYNMKYVGTWNAKQFSIDQKVLVIDRRFGG